MYTVQYASGAEHHLSVRAERDRSGKQSGAGRKLSERERSDEQACEKTMEQKRREVRGSWSGYGAVSGLN